MTDIGLGYLIDCPHHTGSPWYLLTGNKPFIPVQMVRDHITMHALRWYAAHDYMTESMAAHYAALNYGGERGDLLDAIIAATKDLDPK